MDTQTTHQTFAQKNFKEPTTLFGTPRTLLTYSELTAFRNCRRKHYWRYERGLVPVTREMGALWFGDIFHQVLEHWHNGDEQKALEEIEKRFPFCSVPDGEVRVDWVKLMTMFLAYAAKYPHESEDFEVVTLEQEFQCEIRNPTTSGRSRTFIFGGKVDGLIRREDGLWLMEHKTALGNGRQSRLHRQATTGFPDSTLFFDA